MERRITLQQREYQQKISTLLRQFNDDSSGADCPLFLVFVVVVVALLFALIPCLLVYILIVFYVIFFPFHSHLSLTCLPLTSLTIPYTGSGAHEFRLREMEKQVFYYKKLSRDLKAKLRQASEEGWKDRFRELQGNEL